jgi:hypothetical protein
MGVMYSLKIIIFSSVSFLLLTCTSTTKLNRIIPLNPKTWAIINGPAGICLNAEGKGRGVILKNNTEHKVQFDYESLFKDLNQWMLVLDIPLHGEEYLLFKRDLKGISASGPLSQYSKRFPSSIVSWGKFIFLLQEWIELGPTDKMQVFEKQCAKQDLLSNCQWNFKGMKFHYQGDELSSQYEQLKVNWKHWNPELLQFESVEWRWTEKGHRDTAGEKMHLELWPEKC